MIALDDLLALAAVEPDRLGRVIALAGRLKALEAERVQILAELAECGIVDGADAEERAPVPLTDIFVTAFDNRIAKRLPQLGPRCEECGDPATETVDDVAYCAQHGNEAVSRAAMRNASVA